MSIEKITDLDAFDPNAWADVQIHLRPYPRDITPKDADQIVGIMNARRVTFLSIYEVKFTENALDILAKAIGRVQNSFTLTFQKCELQDREAALLAEALKNKQVTYMDLADNQIGDEGAVALANALTINKEASIRLVQNKIGPVGAEALALNVAAAGKSNYDFSINRATLDLSKNNIGDEGAKKIAMALAKHPKTVNTLYLYENGIGDEGDKALAEHLPKEVHTVFYDGQGLRAERKNSPDYEEERTWTEWFLQLIGLLPTPENDQD